MEVTEEPGALVLGVCGVLDAASGPAIAPYLMAGVVSAPSVTIDLRKVVSCDALGLALVDRAVERGQAAGTRVRVTNLDLGSGSDIGAGGAQRRA
jgi:anti-anti-sigma regulatory factor